MAGNNKTLYVQDDELKRLEQDTFGHKHIADAIVQSINNTKPPYIIGVFGGWGTGKSSLLSMIKSNLPERRFATVTIDAWHYSSAENLRRAFLIHVANELNKGYLGELRRRLYSTEQETTSGQKSKLEKAERIGGAKLLEMLLFFFGTGIVFLFILFAIYFTKTWVDIGGFYWAWLRFDWDAYFDKLVELAFVPFLLTFVNYLNFYVVQHPVTVIHERIDADELFSSYFKKIINKVVKQGKLLIVFIDNLDRLNDNKMVEALEGIKAYINNDNCIFVVACDDRVVRSVVNNSPIIPKIKDPSQAGKSEKGESEYPSNDRQRAGEHYLDKFFQQTFRLPEYMGINLQDFAVDSFATTLLYSKLKDEGYDINDVLSILLPTDVNSPRKVKRLINEFIALYEIVRRREQEGRDGQLRPGQITNAIHFLAKFSTLRAEYTDFYQLLTENSSLLDRITQQYLNNEEIGTRLNEEIEKVSNKKSLLDYLRKTRTITTDDIDAFIWLSQDPLTLEMPGSEIKQLRALLADGNTEQVMLMLEKTVEEKKNTFAQVATRIVDKRLFGIEQQNGVRILAYLLPRFDNSINFGIANSAVKLMTQIDKFTAREILNVLRFAKKGGVETQQKKLTDQILHGLEDKENLIKNFEAILDNADVVEDKQLTVRVQGKLAEILKSENQTLAPENTDAEITARIEANRKFADWLISKIDEYKTKNELVIDKYFSAELIGYGIARLFGEFNLKPAYFGDESTGDYTKKILDTVGERVQTGLKREHFWQGLLTLLDSSDLDEMNYVLDTVDKLVMFVPQEIKEPLISNFFIAVKTHADFSPDNRPTDDELKMILQKAIDVTFVVRRNSNSRFDDNKMQTLVSSIEALVKLDLFRGQILIFAQKYSTEFGAAEGAMLITGVLNVVSNSTDNPSLEISLLNEILDIEAFVSEIHRDQIVDKLNYYVLTNDKANIELALPIIARTILIPGYQEKISGHQEEWLEKFGSESIELLKVKIELFLELMQNGLLPADQYVQRIINVLPFGSVPEALHEIFNSINEVNQKITVEYGRKLTSAILAHRDSFGPEVSRALVIASPWAQTLDEAERLLFDATVLERYENSPDEHLPIKSVSWEGLTADQIKDHLMVIHRIDMNNDLVEARDIGTRNAIEQIDVTERPKTILAVWEALLNDRNAAETFAVAAKHSVSLNDLNSMRASFIDAITSDSIAEQDEKSLRFLSATIRDDTRNIMPIVDLFVDMFGRAPEKVQLALKYVVACLNPFGLRDDHKGKLAKAMSAIPIQNDDEVAAITEVAKQLDLRWFKHDSEKHWWE